MESIWRMASRKRKWEGIDASEIECGYEGVTVQCSEGNIASENESEERTSEVFQWEGQQW